VLTRLKNFNFEGINVTTNVESRKSLAAISNILDGISEGRSYLGGFTNRLQSIVANLDVAHENVASANSRIRDTDVAVASAQSVSAQIQESANLAMLKISVNAPKAALRLLE
ncbi:MAG: flagellin, partial [Pseudomonadota bacterium]